MTKRNMKITIAVVIVAFVAFELIGGFYAEKHKYDISAYGYSGKLFLAEGGFEKARIYADSIFSTALCSEESLVYADALYNYDFPNKKLMYAVYKSNNDTNAVYFVYRIPNILHNNDEVTETFDYNENDSSCAVLEFINVEREGAGNYHCDKFNVFGFQKKDKGISEINETVDANKMLIEPDAEVKTLCDYGVLYCDDMEFYTKVYEAERERISSFLLNKQEEFYNGPEFTTTTKDGERHNTQPLVKDAPIFIADDSEKEYKNKKLDFKTGVDAIFRGKKYIDYTEYNKDAEKYNIELEEKRRIEREENANEEVSDNSQQ